MRVLPDLPNLRIVPVPALHPHEHADDRRSAPLVEALRVEGVLRNPPVVLPLGSRPERYMVLDGANRTTAFQQLGLPHVVVQVVHAGSSSVQVETWNHVVLDLPPDELRTCIADTPELALVASDDERAAYELSAGGTLAYLCLADGVYDIVSETEPLEARLDNLERLVGSYLGRGRVERSNARSAVELDRVFPSMTGLIVFRGFEVEEVVTAVAQDRLLPGGLTRFVISSRALRVNYPLARLASSADQEQKQAELDAWIQQRVAARRVRYYAEATFLFDE